VQTSYEIRIDSYQQGIDESFAWTQAWNQDYKRRRLNDSNPTRSLDPDVLEDLYIAWIITATGIPFEMAGNVEFRAAYVPTSLFAPNLANLLY
jgi:hypothetical protein